MSDFKISKCLSLLDKVVMKINGLNKFSKIQDVFLVRCSEPKKLKSVLEHPLTKNIII